MYYWITKQVEVSIIVTLHILVYYRVTAICKSTTFVKRIHRKMNGRMVSLLRYLDYLYAILFLLSSVF